MRNDAHDADLNVSFFPISELVPVVPASENKPVPVVPLKGGGGSRLRGTAPVVPVFEGLESRLRVNDFVGMDDRLRTAYPRVLALSDYARGVIEDRDTPRRKDLLRLIRVQSGHEREAVRDGAEGDAKNALNGLLDSIDRLLLCVEHGVDLKEALWLHMQARTIAEVFQPKVEHAP